MATGQGFNLLSTFVSIESAGTEQTERQIRETLNRIDAEINETRVVRIEVDQSAIDRLPMVDINGRLQFDRGPLNDLLRDGGELNDLFDFEIDTSQFDDLLSTAEELSGETAKLPPSLSRFAATAGRVTVAIGAVAAIATRVSESISEWSNEASGFNAATERSIQLERELADLQSDRLRNRQQQAREAIDAGDSSVLDDLRQQEQNARRAAENFRDQGRLAEVTAEIDRIRRGVDDITGVDQETSLVFDVTLGPLDRIRDSAAGIAESFALDSLLEEQAELQARFEQQINAANELRDVIVPLELRQSEALERRTASQERLNGELQREIDLAAIARERASGNDAAADAIEDRIARQDALNRFAGLGAEAAADAADTVVANQQAERQREADRERQQQQERQQRDAERAAARTQRENERRQRDNQRRLAQAARDAERNAQRRQRIESQIEESRQRQNSLQNESQSTSITNSFQGLFGAIESPLQFNLDQIAAEEKRQVELQQQLVELQRQANDRSAKAEQQLNRVVTRFNQVLQDAANNGGLANC